MVLFETQEGDSTLEDQVFGILFEHGTEAVFSIHRDTRRVLAANSRLEDLVGRSRASLVGMPAGELFADDNRDTRDDDWTSRILDRAGLHEEVALRRLDGYTVFVALTVAHIDHPTAPLVACIARDTTERRILEREVIAKHAALYTAHQELEQAFVRLRETQDRLEERNRELSAVGAQLARAAHHAALGEFSAGIAHSMNNPMAALCSAIRQIQRRIEPEKYPELASDLERFFGRTQHAVSRMEVIVTSIRRAHKTGTLEYKPQRVRLADEIDVILSLFDGRSPRVELHVEGDTDVTAWAPPDALHHVLSNLVDNAIRALRGAGKVRLALRSGDDNRVVVSIIDTGPGVPAAMVDSLFEPFVSGRSDGTGLGLCLARRLARQWGGDVVYVPTDEGARFDVTIHRKEPAW